VIGVPEDYTITVTDSRGEYIPGERSVILVNYEAVPTAIRAYGDDPSAAAAQHENFEAEMYNMCDAVVPGFEKYYIVFSFLCGGTSFASAIYGMRFNEPTNVVFSGTVSSGGSNAMADMEP